ncbi:hypothetical protein [Pseudomonas chlororaphis]|jgi:hypothetical protein|uniref:hypothetical protein n=1 Tax=Pseudomonas chlororaphis TaxID=587753 RepID=UPI002407F3E4|nr:hypothetical protein [Pseudomonas chlororaphis]
MTEETLNETSKAGLPHNLKSLLRDKRTWAFVAALAAAAGVHLSPDVAQALGVLLEAV